MTKKRLVSPTRKKIRNLKQYADMDDATFEEHFENIVSGSEKEVSDEFLEEQVTEKLDKFNDDYDLSDMKINDRLVLRNLIITIISLEDLELEFSSLRDDISERNILLLDRLSNIMTRLRKDISDMQTDLKLTRKIRKEGREEDFIAWLDKVKDYADEFYTEKTLAIFCPECHFLVSTVWLLYPEEDNILKMGCGNIECRHNFEVSLKELYETDNKNYEDAVLP